MFQYLAIVVFLSTLTLPIELFAKEKEKPELKVSLIPDSLIRGADAIVRKDIFNIDFKDIGKVFTTREVAITVFRNRADRLLEFQEEYKSSSSKIKDIVLSYYDKDGKLLQHIPEKNIDDYASDNSAQYITDSRVKYYSFSPVSYPVTIYYSYTTEDKTTLSLPLWIPISGYNLGIEHSEYNLTHFTGAELFVKEFNLKEHQVEKSSPFSYILKGHKALLEEDYSPVFFEIFPMVMIRPKAFEYEGKLGEFVDWQSFGQWIYQSFLQQKNDLNASAVKADISKQYNLNGLEGRQMITTLYDYLKRNMRYIFIGLEEGGLEPLSANKVHTVKYGDCKALSFYMKSLLGIFDIASDYVVVHAGRENDLQPLEDFPSTWPSNHVILHVPNNGDTVWLECTSNDNPAGYLGSFTDDRRVVLVNENGAKLWHTPKYHPHQNKHQKEVKMQLNENGKLVAEVKSTLTGIDYSSIIGMSKLSSDDLVKELKSQVVQMGYEMNITDATINRFEQESPYGELSYVYSVQGFGQMNGEYMFLPLDFEEITMPEFKKNSKRKYPIRLQRGRSTDITMTYQLPKEYTFTISGGDQEISTPYGIYSKKFSFDQVKNELNIARSLIYYDGRYEAFEYNKIKSFFDKVKLAETEKFYIQKRKT